MTIGERLQAARKRRGLTQSEVADLIGVSQPTVHLWETGANRPRYSRLVKIAAVYGIKVRDLLPELRA